MAARFKRIYEDTPGGKYLRRVGTDRYHVLEWIDMDDACGSDNAGQPRYVVELSEIDLVEIPDAARQSAIESCGWTDMPDTPEVLVECLHGYGCAAPLGSWATGNLRRGLRDGRARSAELDDPWEREAAMRRPVNAIGSTAREFMQGDLHSAIDRGVRAGNPNAKLTARIYGASDEAIEAVETEGPRGAVCLTVNLRKLDSDDPIAYAAGLTAGIAGNGCGDGADRKDLADEYVRGYRDGVARRVAR